MSSGILAHIALSILSPPGQDLFTVQEPRRPDAWLQSFEVRCGRETLRVTGYGPQVPARGTAAILANGRPVRGPHAASLQRDLARPAAVYRLSGQCLPDNGGFWFRVHVGEMVYPGERPPGRRVFHAGSAIIRGGRIESYHPLEPSSEEDFWFR